jgi:DNA-binding NarL/FixJ family response regulator
MKINHHAPTHSGAPSGVPFGLRSASASPAVANGRGKPEPLAISIVSNSRLLREGIQLLLAQYLACRLAGEYPASPCPAVAVQHPDNHIALIDSGIGWELSRQWTRFWRSRRPQERVILLEIPNDVETIVGSVETGICAYTLAGASPQEVAATIRLASEGGATCSPEVTARLFARLAERQNGRGMPVELRLLLTEREYEVLQHVVEGESNREIATALTIELRTVKQHVHNIFAKLQLENRVQAAARAADEGWFRS